MKDVLLVGSNPSQKSPDSSAFHPATKSRSTIDTWFDDLDVDLYFDNVINRPTPNNRPLRVSEIRDAIPDIKRRMTRYNKIVALGDAAGRALDIAGIPHFKIPHPSGLCRFWNDKDKARVKIEELRKYVSE